MMLDVSRVLIATEAALELVEPVSFPVARLAERSAICLDIFAADELAVRASIFVRVVNTGAVSQRYDP
jgi:hypothetical protein